LTLDENILKREDITVEEFFEENRLLLEWDLLCGKKGLANKICKKDVHRPGLALAGYFELFAYKRIQVCGNTEISFLKQMDPAKRDTCITEVFSYAIPCIIITNNNKVSREVLEKAEKHNVPVLRTPHATTRAIQLISDYLEEIFSIRSYVHGSLVDVYGIGILITGRSGIGKSEVALDLVARSHRLVADDVVTIMREADGVLIGMGNDILQYNMEIRGVGIVDVRSMFGIRGIRRKKRVEVEVELVDWDKSMNYERLGIDVSYDEILGEKVPIVRLPIYPGKNITVIVETIALNELLKLHGTFAAQEFEERIINQMKEKKKKQYKNFHGRDFE